MTSSPTRRAPRRTDALTRERIVAAAVELLDAAGPDGLTFRVLTERLATGPGAIYHHVANKGELLEAATEAVVAEALAADPDSPAVAADSATATAPAHRGPEPTPRQRIRALALGLSDAIERHPWLAGQFAAQISRGSRLPATLRIFESVGRQVRALGVPESAWFVATSALMHYILGAAGQNAANSAAARELGPGASRTAFLDATATDWEGLDPEEFPFTRAVADQVRRHDDREQYLAGIDLVLAGISALRQSAG